LAKGLRHAQGNVGSRPLIGHYTGLKLRVTGYGKGKRGTTGTGRKHKMPDAQSGTLFGYIGNGLQHYV
jgi:hypothetical protein